MDFRAGGVGTRGGKWGQLVDQSGGYVVTGLALAVQRRTLRRSKELL
jgi:hypothetical protein